MYRYKKKTNTIKYEYTVFKLNKCFCKQKKTKKKTCNAVTCSVQEMALMFAWKLNAGGNLTIEK